MLVKCLTEAELSVGTVVLEVEGKRRTVVEEVVMGIWVRLVLWGTLRSRLRPRSSLFMDEELEQDRMSGPSHPNDLKAKYGARRLIQSESNFLW